MENQEEQQNMVSALLANEPPITHAKIIGLSMLLKTATDPMIEAFVAQFQQMPELKWLGLVEIAFGALNAAERAHVVAVLSSPMPGAATCQQLLEHIKQMESPNRNPEQDRPTLPDGPVEDE